VNPGDHFRCRGSHELSTLHSTDGYTFALQALTVRAAASCGEAQPPRTCDRRRLKSPEGGLFSRGGGKRPPAASAFGVPAPSAGGRYAPTF